MGQSGFVWARRLLTGVPARGIFCCDSTSDRSPRTFGLASPRREYARRRDLALASVLLALWLDTPVAAETPAAPPAPAAANAELPPIVVRTAPAAKPATARKKSAPTAHEAPVAGGAGAAPAAGKAGPGPTVAAFPTGKASEGYRQAKANFGPLGDRPVLDTPFAIYTVPEELITNQHVETFTELTKYIPSLQQQGHPGLEFGPPVIRGMVADDTSANTRIDGMNVRGDTQLPLSLYERFEVLTGPAGALYGFSYPAGTVNGILKRPTAESFIEATAGYTSAARPDISVDASTHTAERTVGVRVNALHSAGEGYVGTSNLERDLLGLAVDLQLGPATKIELGANRYYYDQSGFPGGFAYKGGVVALPGALDATKAGYAQPWSSLTANTDIADARIKHSFGENWSLDAGILRQDATRWFRNRLTNTLNGNGTYKATYSSSASESIVVSNVLNVAGTVYTGPWKHELVFGTNGFDLDSYSMPSTGTGTLGAAIPLDAPRVFANWTNYGFGPKYLAATMRQQTLVQNDTIHFDERWSALVGVSESWLSAKNYNSTTHAVQSSYSRDGVASPVAALMFKPRPDVSTYLSYSSGVQSDIAPSSGVTNPNAALAPLRSEQFEVGVKATVAAIDWTGAVFYIHRPYSAVDVDGAYKNLGRQNDLGAELTARGKLTDDLVLVGGVTWLDTELAGLTGANARNNGNRVVGIPEWQANLLAEYSFARVPGLIASVNLHLVGDRPADADNFSTAGGYVTTDVGLRYASEVAGHKMVWRAAVENLFDRKYWASINGDMSGVGGATNTAYLGAPRTFKASMTVKF